MYTHSATEFIDKQKITRIFRCNLTPITKLVKKKIDGIIRSYLDNEFLSTPRVN